jgi:alpha-L-fucosidase
MLPEAGVKRLKRLGDAIRERYANNLVLQHMPASSNVSAAPDRDPDTFWSAPDGSHHAILDVDFPKPVTFNRARTVTPPRKKLARSKAVRPGSRG